MYLILNYELNFDKNNNLNDYYEVSIPENKNVLIDTFNCIDLNKALRESYLLGDDIHVYCINEETLSIQNDQINENTVYKFQIKSEVPFKILKESSKRLNQNNFMVYKFCSTINELICQNKWEKCIQGLLDNLDFNTLVEVSKFLRNMPKSTKNFDLINDAIEKMEDKLITKSFEVNNLDIEYIAKLLNENNSSKDLIKSRIKIYIYSDITSIEELDINIKILNNIDDKNILKELFLDCVNKLIILSYEIDYDRKEYFKKIEEIIDNIINYFKNNNCEYLSIQEKYASFIKLSKKLYF